MSKKLRIFSVLVLFVVGCTAQWEPQPGQQAQEVQQMSTTYAGNNTFPALITEPSDLDPKPVSSINPALEGLADRTVYLKTRQITGNSINSIFDQPGGSAETLSQLFLPGASDSGRQVVPYSGGGDFALDLGTVALTDAWIVDVSGTAMLDTTDAGYLVLVATFDGTPQDMRIVHFKNNTAAQILDNFHIHLTVAAAAAGAGRFHLEMRHTAGGASAFSLAGQLNMEAILIPVT